MEGKVLIDDKKIRIPQIKGTFTPSALFVAYNIYSVLFIFITL